MEKRLIKRRLLASDKIQEINEATIVMRHFIELSAKLLPYLKELSLIITPSEKEKMDKEKIINVFRNYRFDTSSSRILMHSDILESIKRTFTILENGEYESEEVMNEAVNKFLDEHQTLVQNWIRTDFN